MAATDAGVGYTTGRGVDIAGKNQGGVFDGAAWEAKYGRFDVAGLIDSDAEKQHWLGEAFKRVMAAWPARGDHYDYLNKAGA